MAQETLAEQHYEASTNESGPHWNDPKYPTDQEVSCIWHRQTDTMIWWPQELKDCNSKSVETDS